MTTRSPSNAIPARVIDRVQSRIVVDPDTGCHVSTYSVGSHGYAQVGWHEPGEARSTMVLAHRVAWIAAHGPIAAGMTVDHMCKRRKCVRIDHLRLLTNFENARRTAGRDWPLGQCANGHPNSALQLGGGGHTRCAPCQAEEQRRYRSKRRAP